MNVLVVDHNTYTCSNKTPGLANYSLSGSVAPCLLLKSLCYDTADTASLVFVSVPALYPARL